MSLQNPHWPVLDREELLIIRDPGQMAGFVRGRYPQFNIAVRPTYLSGIGALGEMSPRGLLVGVDPTARKFEHAVAGLRKAAGQRPRIVLCCDPGGEPLARQTLSAGANDYLIYPLRTDELDRALGLAGAEPDRPAGTETLADGLPSWQEFSKLAEVLGGIPDGRGTMLDRLCEWLGDALRTANVRILTPTHGAHVGQADFEPALVETVTAGSHEIARIQVGPRQKQPYSVAEAEKLKRYGQMIGHLLSAADEHRHWQSLAMLDEVTQLPNRRYLLQATEQLIQRAAQQRFRVTVLVLDLDGFKHFNDTYGHAAGDRILYETGQLFSKHCRQHDIVARYGGDEFVMVFWDAEEPRVAGSEHPRDVLALLGRMKKDLRSHAFPELGPEATGCITISGGLATFPWDARDAEGLIARADKALLEAKRAGKNRIYLVGTNESFENSNDLIDDCE